MCIISLDCYSVVCVICVCDCFVTQEGSSTEHRIKSLSSLLQNSVFTYACRSLFKADRLMFALHMVHGMFPDMFKENVSIVVEVFHTVFIHLHHVCDSS